MAVLFDLYKSIKGSQFGLDINGYTGGPKSPRVNVTDGSTTTNIEPHGTTVIGSTSAKTYTLDAPVPGVRKVLHCSAGSTASVQTVNAASGVTFGGTNTIAKFDAANEVLVLEGLTTTLWSVASNVNSVALSTS